MCDHVCSCPKSLASSTNEILHCGLNPSGIAQTDVEEVFHTILGCCSQTLVDSLKDQDIVPENATELSQAYEMLVFLSQGMTSPSELAL